MEVNSIKMYVLTDKQLVVRAKQERSLGGLIIDDVIGRIFYMKRRPKMQFGSVGLGN